jgi:hypothetical protein
VSFTTIFLPIWTLIGFMSNFSTDKAFHFTSSTFSSSSGSTKSISISILPSLRASSSLRLSLRFLSLFFRSLSYVLGNQFCLWLDFYLGLFDFALGSASLQLSKPSNKHLPHFEWSSCSSHLGCHIADHSCTWQLFHHRFPNDLL